MKKLKTIKCIVGLLVGVIILTVVLSVVFAMADNEDDVDHTGEVQAPYSSSYLSGKNYKDVEALFKAEGFTNINFEEIEINSEVLHEQSTTNFKMAKFRILILRRVHQCSWRYDFFGTC